MSESKRKHIQSAAQDNYIPPADAEVMSTTRQPQATTDAKVLAERQKNAHPGVFLRGATWILSRFPLTRHRYQNWRLYLHIMYVNKTAFCRKSNL